MARERGPGVFAGGFAAWPGPSARGARSWLHLMPSFPLQHRARAPSPARGKVGCRGAAGVSPVCFVFLLCSRASAGVGMGECWEAGKRSGE